MLEESILVPLSQALDIGVLDSAPVSGTLYEPSIEASDADSIPEPRLIHGFECLAIATTLNRLETRSHTV
jgi:hypothetical protein